MRLASTSVLLFIACTVIASAVGQEKASKSPLGWGEFVDPSKDCKASRDGNVVTIQVPGKQHDLSPALRKVNAPRILGEVSGDFIAEIETEGELHPGGPSTNPQGHPYNGVGLLLWQDADNLIRLERAAIMRDGQLLSYVNFEHHRASGPPTAQPLEIPDQSVHLRLERRGDRVIGSVSYDGIRWTALEGFPVQLPQTVKVGIAAVNTAKQPFKAQVKRFEVFTRAVPAGEK
jgi:regulation of enolase protein 1 (concanavalin A-like superfamily)